MNKRNIDNISLKLWFVPRCLTGLSLSMMIGMNPHQKVQNNELMASISVEKRFVLSYQKWVLDQIIEG